MKCGYCTILGRPNVGKSTLINALLSKKISIVTPKAQTTRDDVLGIYHEKDFEIIFIDTPGLCEGKEALYEAMNRSARRSLSDVDVALYVIDASEENFQKDDEILASLKMNCPRILVLNKIDLATAPMMEALKEHCQSFYPKDTIVEASALTNFGLKEIKDAVKHFLPEGEAYYPEDMVTDKDGSFVAKEVIREQLLHFLKEEVPHECAVTVDSFETKKESTTIHATIVCEKENQKAIIIGKDGVMIKRISMTARRNLEKMWNRHVALYLKVLCVPNWRNDPRKLQLVGYGERHGQGDD